MQSRDLAQLLDGPGLAHQLEQVDKLIQAEVPDLFRDFLGAKLAAGKKLRPALLLATVVEVNDEALRMAAAVELVHKASLLHDALIDDKLSADDVRRYLLAGDYLLAAGLRLAASVNARLAGELAEIIQRMAEGQALQLSNAYKADSKDRFYQTVITQKTASLFAFSCQAGARLAGCDSQKIKAYESYGLNFGRAFQIIDDIQDGEFQANQLQKARAEAENYLRLAQKRAPAKNLAGLPAYYLAKIVPDTSKMLQ